jgi:nickel/cobalt exporter
LFASPSAVLVIISAFQLHRAALGLALIGAFSVGLAVTLTGVGLALVYGRRAVESRRGFLPALRWLPVASAVAITVLGLAFAANGLTGIR